MNSNVNVNFSSNSVNKGSSFLQCFNNLNLENSEELSCLTGIIANIFQSNIVAISIVSNGQQWIKSSVGITQQPHELANSFCAQTIQNNDVLSIPNTHDDEQFANHPWVIGEPFARSYLGIPLRFSEDEVVGTLCLIHTEEKHYSQQQITLFRDMARQVESMLRLRKLYFETVHQADTDRKNMANSLARYDALVGKAAAGIISINEMGHIQSANQKLLDLLGYTEQEILGKNIKMLMPEQIAKDHDGFLNNYKRGLSQSAQANSSVIGEGRELVALHKSGQYISIHLAVSEVVSEESHSREFIGVITDISENKLYERKMLAERALLTTLHSGITNFTALVSGNQLWDFLKESLLDLTESGSSFIGEVVQSEDGPKLKILAITEPSWSGAAAGDVVDPKENSVLARVFIEGEDVIIPDMPQFDENSNDEHKHTGFSNFIGIPIVDNGEILGMYGFANTSKPVGTDLVNWLDPYTSTCALLIRFYRMVDEKEHVMDQLREARDEMEAASRAKTEFLSSMSHELRTPLNSIIGFSQLLLSQTKAPLADKQKRQAEQIQTSGKHLLTLINEILDLAKIEAGKLSVSIEPANVKTIVDDSIITITPMADASGIGITSIVDKRVSVLADFTRLKQVMINLLSNAVKYNRENGHVEVVLSLNDMFAEIAVKDTGLGIDMEKVDELFEPFNRGDAENTAIEGTGVGLALTKKLVEYMNGQISVISDKSGSTFTVTLPLAEESLQYSEEANNVIETSPIDRKLTAAHEKFEVLYVEDNPANQYLMEEIFDDLDGFNLHCSHEPFLGLEKAKRLQPDLIILDINLPHISGFELLKMIQEDTSIKPVPVIALSANAMESDIARGIASGFDNYLTKPVDIPVFIDILKGYSAQVLEGRKA